MTEIDRLERERPSDRDYRLENKPSSTRLRKSGKTGKLRLCNPSLNIAVLFHFWFCLRLEKRKHAEVNDTREDKFVKSFPNILILDK